MKIFLLLLFVLVIARNAAALTFEEYNRLPVAERAALLADRGNPLHDAAFRWSWRKALGEKGWFWKEEERLEEEKGYVRIEAFFTNYNNLRQPYLWEKLKGQRAAGKVFTKSEGAAFNQEMARPQSYMYEAIPLLAALAPTPQAQAFKTQRFGVVSERPRALANELPLLTEGEMRREMRRADRLMNELKLLPKVTPAQLQAEIDALPEDTPQGMVPGTGQP